MVKGWERTHSKATYRSFKNIILHQRSRQIPTKPPVTLPKRKLLPILETKTSVLTRIEQKYNNKTEEFETNGQKLRMERESAGIGDRYSNMQPSSIPIIDKSLIGKRLDVCHTWDLEEGGTELRLSQGEVIEISNGSNILKPGARSSCYKKGEAVMIKWDENKDKKQLSYESPQRLLKSKWNPKNKHSDGAWRFDIENS